MRLFVFAIGGTGSRVLTSMIMQLASGARPVDSEGKPIMNLSIVPIIIDPHEDNYGLQQVTELLNDYRSIRNRIYGDELNKDGFFSVKIETLHDVNPEGVASDKFFFKMQKVTDNTFERLIGHGNMSIESQLFTELVFSKDELETDMGEGFYGSPNIGCVALNEFKKSPDFNAFRSAFTDGDRLFFIGSIFGGTGAAGLPLFISSIRDLQHEENEDSGKSNCAKAPIGALVVMPYFSIAQDDNSVINENDFIIKTRSALRYYETSLNKYINKIYYIADPSGTQDFTNDPGNVNNQSANKAHVVEFAGALAAFDFLAETDVETGIDSSGRLVAMGDERNRCKAYGLQSDNSNIDFSGLSAQTNRLVMLPMMKFYVLRDFMKKHLVDILDKPFATEHNPKIEKSIVENRELVDLFKKYDEWLKQMRSHGVNAHNLYLFDDVNGDDYSKAFREKPATKSQLIGKKSMKAAAVKRALNSAADELGDATTQEARWFAVANLAIENEIKANFDYSNLIK